MYRMRQNNVQTYYGNPYYEQMAQDPYSGWNYTQTTPYDQFAKPIQPQMMAPFHQQSPNAFGNNPMQNSSFINYFYDENGQMDYGKVITTVSQVANAFQQVTPVVQQINSLIKTFRT